MNKLIEAVKKNDLGAVRKLLAGKYRTRIDEPETRNYCTALETAACCGYVPIMQELIKAGAQVDKSARIDGLTPLLGATSRGHVDAIQVLLDAHAELDQRRPADGSTPLCIAAEEGHLGALQVLLHAGAKVDQPKRDGSTPLCIAVQNDHGNALRVLLGAGATIDQPMKDGTTPLSIAVRRSKVEVLHLLLRAGASVDQGNNLGLTPLYIATQEGKMYAMYMLLCAGAKTDQGNIYGATPLYIAAQVGKVEPLQLLLRAGAQPDKPINDGSTPLSVAAQKGHADVVRILLAYQANVNIKTSFGTVWEVASRTGKTGVVEILDQYRSNPSGCQQQWRREVEIATQLLVERIETNLPASEKKISQSVLTVNVVTPISSQLPTSITLSPSHERSFSEDLQRLTSYLVFYYHQSPTVNFYHDIKREQAETLLKTSHVTEGAFLLRTSSQPNAVAISCRAGNEVKHSLLEIVETGELRYEGQVYSLSDFFQRLAQQLTTPISVEEAAVITGTIKRQQFAPIEAGANIVMPASLFGNPSPIYRPIDAVHGDTIAGLATKSSYPISPNGVPSEALPVSQPLRGSPQPQRSNAPQSVTTPATPVTAISASSDETVAKAIYPYQARGDKELSVNRGDLLTIIRITVDGWCEVELTGKQGWVPSSYVELFIQKKISFRARIALLNNYLISYYQQKAGSTFYHELTKEEREDFFRTAKNGCFLLCVSTQANAITLHCKVENTVAEAIIELSDDGKLLTLAGGDSYSLVGYFAKFSYQLLIPVSVQDVNQQRATVSIAALTPPTRSPIASKPALATRGAGLRALPAPAAKLKIPGASIQVSLTIPATALCSLHVLGEGAFGKVTYGTWLEHTEVAIKELKISGLADWEQDFRNEAQVMANLRSPRVVQFYGVCFEAPLRLVMEYMPKGSLYSLIHSKEMVEWSQRLRISLDIGEGIYFLHAQDPLILHRDLKSLNVLLDANYRAKLTDFGLAQVKQVVKLTSTPASQTTEHNKSVGTVCWMAPELFTPMPDYSTRSDVYAYGVVLWEIASGKIPFHGAAEMRFIPGLVQEGKRDAIPSDTPIKYGELIKRCWALRQDARPAVKDILTELKVIAKEFSPNETTSERDESESIGSNSNSNSATNSSASLGSLGSFGAKGNLASDATKTGTTSPSLNTSARDSGGLQSFAPRNNLDSEAVRGLQHKR